MYCHTVSDGGFAHELTLPPCTDRRIGMTQSLPEYGFGYVDVPDEPRPVLGHEGIVASRTAMTPGHPKSTFPAGRAMVRPTGD